MGKTTKGGRALHVFGALERGGAETWFLQALAHRGESPWLADICLLAGREGPCADQARAQGVRVLHCPYKPAATFPARFLRLLREERYDAVHSHVLLFGGVIAALAKRAGVPLRAVHAHNSSDGKPDTAMRGAYRALMRRLIAEHATLTLACSAEAAKTLGADGASILPYGIDLEPFIGTPDGLRQRLGIDAEARVLFAAGSLTHQKNHAFLLEAFAETLKLRPDTDLLIAGEGPLRQELASLAEALGIAERVRLLGLRDDVPDLLLNVADAFVMPSLHEGLPVALLEAQAAGLPCLISQDISDEAIVMDGQVEKLALTGPWAHRMTATRARVDPVEAVDRMRRAGFDVAGCWANLTEQYEAALGRAWKATAA